MKNIIIPINNEEKGPITADRLQTAIDDEFGNKAENAYVAIPDPSVNQLTREQLENFLDKDTTDLLQYRTRVNDCDDFAYIMLGLIRNEFGSCTFGIIWHNEHAQNIWYDPEEKEIWLVEPQTDKIERWKGESEVHLVLF